MEESTGLVDITGRPITELLGSTPDSALERVLRMVRDHEMAHPEEQTVRPFSSACPDPDETDRPGTAAA